MALRRSRISAEAMRLEAISRRALVAVVLLVAVLTIAAGPGSSSRRPHLGSCAACVRHGR